MYVGDAVVYSVVASNRVSKFRMDLNIVGV